MMRPMLRSFQLVVPAFLLLFMGAPALAQRAAPLGVQSHRVPSAAAHGGVMMADSGGMPRWVKWGLVGAAGGAALFAAAGQSNTDPGHSVAGDALYGAATGFVLVGGAVALWDWLCHGDTSSRRAGMCG